VADKTPTLRVATCSEEQVGIGCLLDGRYEIHGLIGRGAGGSVYDARDRTSGEARAIKVAWSGGKQKRKATVRFVREAAITTTLVAANTVAMYDYGQTEGGELFAVMERLAGENLSDRLRRFRQRGRPLHSAEVLKIAVSVLKSLAEAHGHGLVHRDIKPGNIIFHRMGDDEAVKLVDFGLVRIAGSELTGAGHSMGTPTYMSPEVAGGHEVDPRSDIYSLACVMYQCICGEPPFAGRDQVIAVMKAHMFEEPKPLRRRVPNVEADLAEVIHICLAKDPARRFQSAEAMSAALRSVQVESGFRRPGASTTGPEMQARKLDPRSQVGLAMIQPGSSGSSAEATKPPVARRDTVPNGQLESLGTGETPAVEQEPTVGPTELLDDQGLRIVALQSRLRTRSQKER